MKNVTISKRVSTKISRQRNMVVEQWMIKYENLNKKLIMSAHSRVYQYFSKVRTCLRMYVMEHSS